MIGRTISGYEVLELAGSGGMGRVFRARDLRLGRLVALKLLHLENLADTQQRQRLLREARAYSTLNHPGVVSVYAVGEDHGMDFIAMEWISGQPLSERLAAGQMPVEQVLDIALQLTAALAAVHRAGLVHRDLKPQNVMIDTDDKVTVLDLGIAKLEGALIAATLTDVPLTGEGMAPGTVAYMSPEQALGESVDKRSDIFAFGVVLYEMLTGCRPFRGDTMPALVRQLLFADPKPLHELRQDVSEGLETLVSMALAKKPQDRYPDMEALALDLRKLQAPQPPTAVQPHGTSAREPPVRHRARVFLVACAALGILLGYSAFISRLPNLDGPPDVGPAKHIPTLPPTPYELYEEGMQRLSRFDRDGYLDQAIARFETVIEASPNYAPAHVGLAKAYWRQFRSKRDPGWLERAGQNARRAFELDPLLLDARILLARIKASGGLLEEAKAELETLRKLDPHRADTVAGLAEVAQLASDWATATRLYSEALILAPQDWELYSLLGGAQLAVGNLEAAAEAFHGSIELVPDNGLARRNLGAVLHYQGRYGEAVTEFQKSITIRPSARAYSNLGTAYFYQGAYREAATAFEAARKLGANHYLLWGNLGDAYRQIAGKDEESILCFQRAVQLLKTTMADTPSNPASRSRLALYLVKAGNPAQALVEMEQLEPLSAQDLPDIAAIGYRATVVYELAGQRQSALHALRIALENEYPSVEILEDPELIQLREDVAFHELMVRFETPVED